jgi:hypothetical protein
MPVAVANMTAQQSSATGTGDRVLDGAALANCRAFASAFSTGDTVSATILDRATGDTEVGVYILRASPARLEVVSIRLALGPNASGGPTSPVSFVAGPKDVLCDVQAEDLPDNEGVFSLASVGAADGWGVPGEWWVKALGTQQIVANSQILLPFTARRTGLLVGVEVCITTASGVGGSVIVASLYDERPMNGAYVGGGAKIADLATLASDSTGSKSVVGLTVPLIAGRAYLLTLSASHTATMWAAAVDAAGARNIRADSITSNRGRQANLPMAQGSSYPPPSTAPTFPGSLSNVGASGSPSQILWPPLLRLQ